MKVSVEHLELTCVSFHFPYPSGTIISVAETRIGEQL